MIEGPLNDAPSLAAILDEARKLVPGKPIKYLVNTHNHFDHAGGIRAYVAEGATVITQPANKPFYEQVWKAPAHSRARRLSKNPKKASFITFKDKYVLTDGGSSIEVYQVDGDNHNAGISIVYLPKEKILVEADDFTPAPPNAPSHGTSRPRLHGSFVHGYVQKLNLDVHTIAPLHGFVVPFSDLQKAAGS